MLLTVSGPPGSGKTTVAEKLSAELGFKLISAGSLFRQLAAEKGLPLPEFSKIADSNHKIDLDIDKQIVNTARAAENLIIDGRLAAHMMVRNKINAFKIYINASLDIRAERISKRDKCSFQTAKKAIVERERSEQNRYLQIYKINLDDLSVYDLRIDSSSKSVDEIVKIILNAVKLVMHNG